MNGLNSVAAVMVFLVASAAHAGAREDYMALRARAASAEFGLQTQAVKAQEPTPRAAAPGRLNNGSFESGDFRGWTVFDDLNSGAPTYPWTVCTATSSCKPLFDNLDPINGRFEAVNGFDGTPFFDEPLKSVLEQTFVPVAGQAELSFRYRIQYDGFEQPSTKPRIMRAQLFDSENRLLRTLKVERINLNGQAYTDLGWKRVRADLSSLLGQTLVLRITLLVPEFLTGPALIEFDDFRPRNLQVGGSAAGIVPGQVSCQNLKSGQTVNFELPQEGQWDCTEFGLAGEKGDRVRQVITGPIN